MKNITKYAALVVLSLSSAVIYSSCRKSEEQRNIKLNTLAANCPRIQAMKSDKAEPQYKVTTFAGAHESKGFLVDGVLCKSRFYEPFGLAFAPDGSLFISDVGNSNIRKISSEGIVSIFAGSTIGGGFDWGYSDGKGTAAQFASPTKSIFSRNGYLLTIDQGGGAIRKANFDAQISTYLLTNNLEHSGYQDGPLAQSKFRLLQSITEDSFSSIYLVDQVGSVIRKISPNNIVSTYAGQKPIGQTPTTGFQDGSRESALFQYIRDITFDKNGMLYIADLGNKKIRRITTEGIVETVADLEIESLAADAEGNIYAASKTAVYKINPSGEVKLIAGGQTSAYKDGIGTAARFLQIRGMVVKGTNLYLTDGPVIRKIAL